MLGIAGADLISAGLALALGPIALLGYRINQRCKVRSVWWSHADGFVNERHIALRSTPASNFGLALFTGAITGLFLIALAASVRHHAAESFIFLALWTPLALGVLAVVGLPLVLAAKWTARAVSGLKQTR